MTITNDVDFSGVTYFQLKGNGSPTDAFRCRLYRNNRQKIFVEILIEVVDANGQIVTLSDAQLNTIKIVYYGSGEEINDFSVSREPGIFDPLPNFTSTETPPHSDPTLNQQQSTRFYLSTGNAPIGLNQLAAKITNKEGIVFHTCSKDVPAGTVIPKGDKFNSSFIAEVLAPDVSFSDITLERFDRDDEHIRFFADLDMYYIRFRNREEIRQCEFIHGTGLFNRQSEGSAFINSAMVFDYKKEDYYHDHRMITFPGALLKILVNSGGNAVVASRVREIFPIELSVSSTQKAVWIYNKMGNGVLVELYCKSSGNLIEIREITN